MTRSAFIESKSTLEFCACESKIDMFRSRTKIAVVRSMITFPPPFAPVAQLDRRLAQSLQTHSAFRQVLLRYRRILENVAFSVWHKTIQVILATINSLQNSRHGKNLECAAHRKTLVRSI